MRVHAYSSTDPAAPACGAKGDGAIAGVPVYVGSSDPRDVTCPDCRATLDFRWNAETAPAHP